MTARDNRVTRRANIGRLTPQSGDPHDVREIRGMLRTLEHLGYDLDELLADTDLRREDVANPDAYISPRACAAVFARACRERRVPNLALQLAMRTPIGANPLLDYLILSADTVGHGLARLVRYLRLVNPGIRLSLSDTVTPVRVIVERAPGVFEAELTIALSVVRFANETDGRMQAAYVSFSHEPDDAAEYARVLKCPVRTRASWSGWALARDAMGLPLRRRDAVLGRWLERQAAELESRQPADGDARDEVRSVLSTQATTGDLRIDAVARVLAVTPRTLQRRLAKLGTSFETLLDDVRRQAAETYLSNPTLSISDVTYLLGYSEPTAFHRAFKRWHARRHAAGVPRETLPSADEDAAVKVVAHVSTRHAGPMSGRRNTPRGEKISVRRFTRTGTRPSNSNGTGTPFTGETSMRSAALPVRPPAVTSSRTSCAPAPGLGTQTSNPLAISLPSTSPASPDRLRHDRRRSSPFQTDATASRRIPNPSSWDTGWRQSAVSAAATQRPSSS